MHPHSAWGNLAGMTNEFTILVLLILGLALMVLEAFAPAFGVLGIAGAASFYTALVLAHNLGSLYGVEVDIPTLIATGVIGIVILGVSFYCTFKSRRSKIAAGAEIMTGMKARVLAWQGTNGRVHVDGEEWAATGPTGLNTGDSVTIITRDNLTLTVKQDL